LRKLRVNYTVDDMTLAEALYWLVQNPESVLLRGSRQPLTLSNFGSVMQLSPAGPRYARLNVRDIVAADWQGMAIDAFVRQAEQMKQSDGE
jgi:hypothetical protein